jgi:hypothetical protein
MPGFLFYFIFLQSLSYQAFQFFFDLKKSSLVKSPVNFDGRVQVAINSMLQNLIIGVFYALPFRQTNCKKIWCPPDHSLEMD